MKREKNELSERKRLILRAVVDAHIHNGEPVGSKYLTTNKQIGLSSATIRNEMAELEEMGYLEQPHTSAGRIPSEHGYRMYVDNLMKRYELSIREYEEMNNLLRERYNELETLMERASRLIAQITNYTSLSVRSRLRTGTIKHFKLVKLSEDTLLIIMVTDDDSVKTRQIRVGSGISNELIEKLETTLNLNLSGLHAEDVTLPLMMRIERAAGAAAPLIAPLIKCAYETLEESAGGELRFEGLTKLLQYPEYSDVSHVKNLLEAFDQKDEIIKMVSNSRKNETNVVIGSENSVDIMKNSSLVYRLITSGDRVVGAIGIVGPCRMDYSKVVATMDQLAANIDEIINGGKNEQ